MIFKSKIYATLFISFFLFLFSLYFSYSNINERSTTLKQLEKDQVELNYYANKLNYDIKRNQAYFLQANILDNNLSHKKQDGIFQDIHKNIAHLELFVQEHPLTSLEFKKTINIIKKRVIAYQLVQDSIVEAMKLNDKEDVKDAIIGFNDITMTFSSDTQELISLANKQIYQSILLLEENNKESSKTLLFTFFLVFIIIGSSAMKFIALHTRVREQLENVQKAEKELQHAQMQLQKYNDNLESEISKKTSELYEKIYTNALSGLPNRNKLLEDTRNYNIKGVAILDIDKFQSFNDVYGEEVGNIALRMSANFLQQNLKERDLTLYHTSGDEFVVTCFKNEKPEDYFLLEVEKILTRFKSEKFVYEDKNFQFMMSAGIACGKKHKMLAYADMALKDAKKRNVQISVYDDAHTLEKNHKDNIKYKEKLSKAIENNKIISYYQPIVPISDINLEQKYESLVRIDDNGDIIPPFRFIDVAKANRVYYRITRAVIKNTLTTIQKYQIPCSINISLTDIKNERTMKHFFETLDAFEYNNLLTVELLETEDFQNYNEVYNFCMRLKSYGVTIALDDFGSGYSNFSHILRLPVDFIKIDATLISKIDQDNNSRIMVETIVQLAHSLHILTIAEFVASKEILDVVTEIGVDYAQGFYLGKPENIQHYMPEIES